MKRSMNTRHSYPKLLLLAQFRYFPNDSAKLKLSRRTPATSYRKTVYTHLQIEILHQMPAERSTACFLYVQEHHHVVCVNVELKVLVQHLLVAQSRIGQLLLLLLLLIDSVGRLVEAHLSLSALRLPSLLHRPVLSPTSSPCSCRAVLWRQRGNVRGADDHLSLSERTDLWNANESVEAVVSKVGRTNRKPLGRSR